MFAAGLFVRNLSEDFDTNTHIKLQDNGSQNQSEKSFNELQHFVHSPVQSAVTTGTNTNIADQLLVQRILGGDHDAFGHLIKDTEKLVARFVFDMISNAGERKDLAQDIYLKVYQKLPGFKFQARLSTWIAQIAYNACIDHLRKRKLIFPDHEKNYLEEANEIDHLDLLNTRAGIMTEASDNFVIRKNMTEIVRSGIKLLPPVYRTLINLYHNEELSYEEIGDITGMPAGTVKSYLFRARKELRRIILRQYKKEDIW